MNGWGQDCGSSCSFPDTWNGFLEKLVVTLIKFVIIVELEVCYCVSKSLPLIPVKLALHATKAYRGSRNTAIFVFNLTFRKWWVVSITPWLLYPIKEPQYLINGCLAGPQSWSHHFGEVRILFPLPGFNSWTVQPVTYLISDWVITASKPGAWSLL